MRIIPYVALVTGLGIATALVAGSGFDTVVAAVTRLGAGVLLLPAIYALHLLGAAASWGLLFPHGVRVAFSRLLRAVWIGTSVEAMLPAASLGAELVKARLLMRAGLRGNDAATSVVVDVTVQGAVLAIWACVGFGLLVLSGAGPLLKLAAATGAALMTVAIAGFLLSQRAGLFGFLARRGAAALRRARWQGMIESAVALDRSIRSVYARPARILCAIGIRSVSRSALVLELWFVAALMGYQVGVADAAMLMGLVSAIRAATIVIPGGWGVQEGAFVLLGGWIGLPPEIMLAISLSTRARELIVGIPALLAWQVIEGYRLKALLARTKP